MAQAWWWLAASLVVVSLAPLLPVRVRVREPGLWMLALCLVALSWSWRMPGAVVWLAQLLAWMLAGWVLVERFGWTPLRWAVQVCAWAQLGAWMAQRLWAWDAYGVNPASRYGTVGRRAALGIVFGVASLWSGGWQAWTLAILSGLTGSWTGAVLPALRLLPIRWRHPLNGVAILSAMVLTHRWWIERLRTRWEVWSASEAWRGLPWHGIGLMQLRSAFREDGLADLAGDLHNTWLDVWARGGWIGVALLLAVMAWAFVRSRATRAVWTWLFACWVMCWQSVAAQPVMMVLALVWLLSLTNPRTEAA